MPNPIVHFEINSPKGQGQAIQDFYKNLFGWAINADNPMNYGFVEPQGGGIGGGITEGEHPMVTVYIEVDDPEAYLNKVQQAGGKTLVPVTVIPDMVTFALFADPFGNAIGLVKSEPHAH